MSNKYFIHATLPISMLVLADHNYHPAFLAMKEDSIDGIYSTLRDCATSQSGQAVLVSTPTIFALKQYDPWN